MTSAITTVNLEAREMMAGNCDVLATYAGTSMSDPSLVGRLPDVRLPARLSWGDSDRIADAGYGRADAAAVSDARFHLLKDIGHVPWVEAPGQLLAAIWDHADTMSDGKASDMVPDVETLVPGAPDCERFGAGDATWQS